MNLNTTRFKAAFKAMCVHFGLSLLVAATIAWLVFTVWFPYPYRELAGGSELFMLVIAVDLVCGPLLTLVLYAPTKPKREILTDISLVVVIQLLALCYGVWTMWQVRPMYVVQEADRFTIMSRANLALNEVDALPNELRPNYFGGPVQVSLRDLTVAETEKLNSEIKAGGHDAAEHPSLYVKFDGGKTYQRAHPMKNLILTQPRLKIQLEAIALKQNSTLEQLRYSYFVGRNYVIAVINVQGNPVAYLRE